MSIDKIHQLNGVPDFRYEESPYIDYASISIDADSKLISIMEAVGCIGSSLMNDSDQKQIDAGEVNRLSGVILSLSEVAIFINKISTNAHYLSGLKDGSGVDANQ
ncbi:hypothetical protein D3C81_303040 [compost metagenome]